MARYVFLFVSVLLVTFCAVAAPTGVVTNAPLLSPLSRIRNLPQPYTSQDNVVSVHAGVAQRNYRMPVLTFIERERSTFARLTALKDSMTYVSIAVMIGNQTDGETRVPTHWMRMRDGAYRLRITLLDPEAASLESIREAVFRALFVNALLSRAKERGGPTCRIPAWILRGVLRNVDPRTRMADNDVVYRAWQAGELPTFSRVASNEGGILNRSPALAGFLVQWLLDREANRPSVFSAVIDACAAGDTLKTGTLAALLTGTTDRVAQDAVFDARIAASPLYVAVPGLTAAANVTWFKAHLLLYSPYFGTLFANGSTTCTFAEAAEAYEYDPLVRYVALVKAEEILWPAIGRDTQLERVARAYQEFLLALARGARKGDVRWLLKEADAKLDALTADTTDGRVLIRK